MFPDHPPPSRARRLLTPQVLLALLLALLVHAPSLGWGYLADDFGARLVCEGRFDSPTWKPWSLFDFGSLDLASGSTIERGAYPWWVDPDWRVRFFRPLSSLSMCLDAWLFGDSAPAAHAHSLLLLALLLLSALALYERLGLSRRAAILAILVVAFDNGALMPVGWLSNRNSLLEGLFTLLALHAGLRAAREPGALRVALALALASASTAAKESGLCSFALLALLFLGASREAADPRALRAAAAACGLCVLAYLAFYVSRGQGSNVLFYPTPWGAPLEFASRALALLVCAPIAAVAPFPTDALALEPARAWAILAAAFALGLPVVVSFARRLRGTPNAAFLAVWGLLALAPQAGAPASDRLMFTPLLAWAPLIALYLERALGSRELQPRTPPGTRRLAWAIAASSLLASPVMLLGLGAAMLPNAKQLRELIAQADVGEEGLGLRHAFLLQASPSALIALAPLAVWLGQGGSEQVSFHPLQFGRRALLWTRLGEASFSLESLDEPFLTHPMESVFMTRAARQTGTRAWNSGAFAVRGLPDPDGNLRRIDVQLELSLDDPRCRFLLFDGERLRRREPPAIGASLSLPRGVRDPLLP